MSCEPFGYARMTGWRSFVSICGTQHGALRSSAFMWSVAKPLLACGATVVIEWGLWARRERDELRDQARSMGAAVELCFLDAPVELLRQRVRERGVERWPGSAPITRDHLEQWDAELERPDAAEHALYDPPTCAINAGLAAERSWPEIRERRPCYPRRQRRRLP
jgi:hypothetical protein